MNKRSTIKNGFTYVEILAAIAVIGFLALLVIPRFIDGIQSKMFDTQKKTTLLNLKEATDLMDVKENLTGYNSNEEFATAFTNVYKATKVCKVGNLSECFAQNFELSTGDKIDVNSLTIGGNLGLYSTSPLVGLLGADGGTMLLAYNPQCNNPDFKYTNSLSCISAIFDVNGFKKPNKEGKDIYSLNASVNQCSGGQVSVNGACECMPGYALENGQCTKQCAAGEELVGDDCLTACAESETRLNGVCVSKCGTNEVYSGGTCTCASGYETYNGSCVAVCGANQTRNASGVCMCNSGYEFLNGNCVATCGANQTRNASGTCVCNSGYTLVSGTCTLVDSGGGSSDPTPGTCQTVGSVCITTYDVPFSPINTCSGSADRQYDVYNTTYTDTESVCSNNYWAGARKACAELGMTMLSFDEGLDSSVQKFIWPTSNGSGSDSTALYWMLEVDYRAADMQHINSAENVRVDSGAYGVSSKARSAPRLRCVK